MVTLLIGKKGTGKTKKLMDTHKLLNLSFIIIFYQKYNFTSFHVPADMPVVFISTDTISVSLKLHPVNSLSAFSELNVNAAGIHMPSFFLQWFLIPRFHCLIIYR